ncbi:hypothetical protein [Rhodococcus sp. 14-2470-1a]|uniref:hypothetical protein n=1 Tax=Rhodococcus sp. 14-2470-1a TaxID=2023150 RepID=UPI000B9A3FC9|nr:hypothetical protein [Rhodococcus sp. 14-2470-1a]OZF41932.1 hypothetical protein CH292_27385 [Rhodococcus sp. 14-2470-1a]
MPLSVDGRKIGGVHVGAQAIGEGWVWDGSSWSQVFSSVPPEVSPMGMWLTETATFTTTITKLGPMAAMSDRPDTAIVDNMLVADGPGVRTLHVRIVWSGTYMPTYYVYKNGERLASDTATIPDVPIAAGDQFWVSARNGFGSGRATGGSETSTYLYWD